MARWTIAVPVWGERCIETFHKCALPSLVKAIKFAGTSVKFLIHTDAPHRIKIEEYEVEFSPLEKDRNSHITLSYAHRDVLNSAGSGQLIALWCADMAASVECFAAAEKRFAEGKRIVMAAATRTFGETPPSGLVSRKLLRWAMEYRHPIIAECFWGQGRSGVPWAIYFERNGSIALRAFHLHPFAVMKDRQLSFSGATVDFGLAELFKPEEIHVVTDADEMSLAEMSPVMERRFPVRNFPMNEATVADWARRNTIGVHREFFRDHPICIAGKPDGYERAVCDRILSKI